MRIIYFTNNYFPRLSGVSRAVYNYKVGLERLGHKIMIVSPKYYFLDFSNGIDNLKVSSFRLGKIFGSLNYPIPAPILLQIEEMLNNFKPDIIHSHHPFFLGNIALRLKKKYNLPLVYTYHTPYFKYFDSSSILNPTFLIKIGFQQLVSNYIKECDRVILPSPKMSEHLDKNDLKKVEILATPIDATIFKNPEHNFLRKKYNLKDTDKIVLTVSRLSYEKNIPFLINSFASICKEINDAYFFIVGSGYLKSFLQLQVASIGLQNRIIFCGKVEYRCLKNYYAGSDLFIYASLFDSQALVLSEAIVSKTPVLVFDEFKGVSYFIKDNETGFIAKTQDEFTQKLKTVLLNKDLRSKISQNQGNLTLEFDINGIANKIEKIYSSLIN